MHVELLLEFLVGIVYAQLLERVRSTAFLIRLEAKDVKQADLSQFLRVFCSLTLRDTQAIVNSFEDLVIQSCIYLLDQGLLRAFGFSLRVIDFDDLARVRDCLLKQTFSECLWFYFEQRGCPGDLIL